MSRHRQLLSFGAVVEDDGTRFRLWAPAARKVAVELDDGERPLQRGEDGWFEVSIPELGAGALYRYRIDDGQLVPDPASRFQPRDINGPSEVIDSLAFDWDEGAWRGRPWHEAVIYELHVGTFTPEGTFAAAADQFHRLARLGVTAVELMPVADFAGMRNWGYDGVLPFAPDGSYGRPEDLKRLVSAAHRCGLMVFIDVVYNHFGPEGNYLGLYAPQFFKDSETSWGRAIDFSRPEVRRFFIENALYWLFEYRADGLRFDAVHAIEDASEPGILDELAAAVRSRAGDRHLHLVLENDNNDPRLLTRDEDGRVRAFDAQWNDDFHHAMHVLLTGERDGYYVDYVDDPRTRLMRSLTSGFAYQGEYSRHRQRNRGDRSGHLPSTAFVNFLQNHDQIGNRAFGERLAAQVPPDRLAAAAAILLLAPSPPLIFMGEEEGARTPFLFFCDFAGDLATAVRDGRRREFARFAAFADERAREAIPDPLDVATFERSKLGPALDREPTLAQVYEELLRIRHGEIIPRLEGLRGGNAGFLLENALATVWWRLGDGSELRLEANLSDTAVPADPPSTEWRLIYATQPDERARLVPWSVRWWLRPAPP